jgi:hypothetical protein
MHHLAMGFKVLYCQHRQCGVLSQVWEVNLMPNIDSASSYDVDARRRNEKQYLSTRPGAFTAKLNSVLPEILIGTIAALGSWFTTALFEGIIREKFGTWATWILAGAITVLILLFFILAIGRNKLSKENWGTAYYISILEVGMIDGYAGPFRSIKAGQDYDDLRVVTEKLSAISKYGYNWVHEIKIAARRVQDSMNEDDVSSGFILHPNALVSASISVGSQIQSPHKEELAEIPMFATPNTDLTDIPRWTLPDFSFDKIDSNSVTIKKTTQDDDGFILLVLSIHSSSPQPDVSWRYSHKIEVRPKEEYKLAKVGQIAASHPKNGVIEGADLLFRCLTALKLAITIDHIQPIVLLAQLPKTVAFALGQNLDQLASACGMKESIWRRLVIMHYDLAIRDWYPTRVHPAQPPLSEIYDMLVACGYSFPPERS